MERRAKVELFEQIRREHEFKGQSIRSLARQFGVHRRMVRQALVVCAAAGAQTTSARAPQNRVGAFLH